MKTTETNLKTCEAYLTTQGHDKGAIFFVQYMSSVVAQKNLMKVLVPFVMFASIYMLTLQQNVVLSLTFSLLTVCVAVNIAYINKNLNKLNEKLKVMLGEQEFIRMESYVESHQAEAKNLLVSLLSLNRLTSNVKEKVKH